MGAVWFRARAELRARWKAWLSIALLMGIFGGATAAVAAGARRTASAYPRFLERARSLDVFVGDFSVFNPELFWKPDFEAIGSSDLVEDSAMVRYFFGTSDDELLAPLGDEFMRTVNVPKILAGRMPVSADEVSIPFAWERSGPRSVGDIVRLGFDDGSDDIEMTIVGIHAMPGDFPPTDLLGETFIASAAFTERWSERQLPSTDAILARLADGVGEAEFEAMLRARAGGKLVNVYRNKDQAQNVQRSFDLQAIALWLLAGGLGLATLLVVGQSAARQSGLENSDADVLRALGMARWQVAATAMLKGLTAGVIAGGIAVVTAALASPIFPRGSAAIAEPDPGFALDLAIVGGMVGATLLIVAIAATLPSLRSGRRVEVPASPSLAAIMAARVGSPPTTVAGVRFALESGRGPRAVPVRSTIVAISLGLASLTGAFTFAANLDALISTPDLYGLGWNHMYGFGGDFSSVPDSATPAAIDDPSVEAAAAGTTGLVFDLHVEGRDVLPVTGMALADPIKGSVIAEPIAGRYPRRNEIVLGPRTMDRLELQVGDRIRIGLQGADAHPVAVVGEVILPPLAEQSQFGDGVLVHYDTLTGGLAPGEVAEAPPPDQLLIRFAGLRPHDEEVEAFRKKLENVDQDYTMIDAADLANFGRVQNLPLVLAGLLAALAAGALIHVLLTAIRRRRRDLAILKTLGFNRRQARRTVGWQASVVVGIALALGIPGGILAGRALWSLFAARAYVIVEYVTPWTAIGLTVPAALLLANLIAALPARAAARTSPAVVLRAE